MTDVIRKSRSWRVVVPTLLLLGVGYCILWPDLNDRIRRDLEDKVSGGAGNTIVGNYDFVCFSAVTGRAVAEFEPILTRKDPRYADTASSCGVIERAAIWTAIGTTSGSQKMDGSNAWPFDPCC